MSAPLIALPALLAMQRRAAVETEAALLQQAKIDKANRKQLNRRLNRELYGRLQGPIERKRVKGGPWLSLKMFAGDPASPLAYFVSNEGSLVVIRKHRWTALERPRRIAKEMLSPADVARLLPLVKEAYRTRHCVQVASRH